MHCNITCLENYHFTGHRQLENPNPSPLTFFCGFFASSELRETERAHYLIPLVLLSEVASLVYDFNLMLENEITASLQEAI